MHREPQKRMLRLFEQSEIQRQYAVQFLEKGEGAKEKYKKGGKL